jgi:hypothetical protein
MNATWRIVLLAVLPFMGLPASAAEPITPIDSLLVNPTALHRKVLKLEGIATNVATYSGSEGGTNQSLCGAEFQLEDGTGAITVLYHVRCQAGDQRAAIVSEKMRIIVEGHMEAPPTVMRGADGNDFGFRIVARQVTPAKP